jgi:hypothetical protein
MAIKMFAREYRSGNMTDKSQEDVEIKDKNPPIEDISNLNRYSTEKNYWRSWPP